MSETVIIPQKVSALDIAFGPERIGDLMPKYESIPDEFKRPGGKWNKIFSDFFYKGAKNIKWTAKEGIDKNDAVGNVRAIMGSFEPKHEHKEAACAYLMSLWFDDITYEVRA